MLNVDHTPVLLDEVIKVIQPAEGKIYVDCTFGAGGYSLRMLRESQCKVIAIDRDPDAQIYSNILQKEYGNRFSFHNVSFSQLDEVLQEEGINDGVDAIVLDLGVSSMQLDRAERGFAFSKNATLDMRMSQSGKSAHDFVNLESEGTIAEVLYKYADEKFSRKIARKIVEVRKNKPIETTFELADLVRGVLPAKFKGHRTDPATKTFQAIRIWVNDELEEIELILKLSKNLLKLGGKLIIVTFHSTEDRIVKHFLGAHSKQQPVISRYLPEPKDKELPWFKLLNNKVVIPSDEETNNNIRSRSAKLRAAQKIREV